MKKFLLPVIILSLLFACSTDELTYTVEMRDGVRHVINTGTAWKSSEGVELEFVRTIGDFEGTDENLIFFNLYDIAIDKEGNLYLLDSGNNRVQVFDPDSEYLRTIGRKGQGPGEFEHSRSITISNNGTLYLPKLMGSNILEFDETGKEIERFPYPQGYNFIRAIPGSIDLFGQKQLGYAMGYNKESNEHFAVFNLEGEILHSFGSMFGYNNEYSDGVQTTLFIPDAAITISQDGTLLSAKNFNNLIEKYDLKGNLLMSVIRPLNYEMKEPEFSSGKFKAQYVSDYIGVDSKNRIWVNTNHSQPKDGDYNRENYDSSKYEHLEIFSSEGILLGYLPHPENFGKYLIFGDRMFIIDSNQISVSEYRIKELN